MKQIIVYTTLFSALALVIFSCKKEKYPFPCSPCEVEVVIDEKVSPNAYTDSLGFIHVPYNGLNYFTIEANISEINSDYIINGVPLVEIAWDSDYWVIFDSIGFTISIYNIFSSFDGSGTLLPIADTTLYWDNDIPPTNIMGYTYSANKIRGVSTQYSYKVRKPVLLFPEMIGDTVTLYFKATWNTDDLGLSYSKLDSIKVIID